jgi:hypothetical protein
LRLLSGRLVASLSHPSLTSTATRAPVALHSLTTVVEALLLVVEALLLVVEALLLVVEALLLVVEALLLVVEALLVVVVPTATLPRQLRRLCPAVDLRRVHSEAPGMTVPATSQSSSPLLQP